MVAVVLATAGVTLVVYGRTAVTPKNQSQAAVPTVSVSNAPSAPVFGNLLALAPRLHTGYIKFCTRYTLPSQTTWERKKGPIPEFIRS